MATAVWSAKRPPMVMHRATARAFAQVAPFAGTDTQFSVNCLPSTGISGNGNSTVKHNGAGRPEGPGGCSG